MSNITKTRSSLCWRCRKSTNSGCSWSASLTPVKGWKAEEDLLSTNMKDKVSYMVIECPEFLDDNAMRCEVCKFYETQDRSLLYGYCRKHKRAANVLGICSKGERR